MGIFFISVTFLCVLFCHSHKPKMLKYKVVLFHGNVDRLRKESDIPQYNGVLV